MYKIFSELTDQIDQAGLTDEQREKDTEAKLSELRALSIVADDWVRKDESGLFSSLSEWIALFSGSSRVQTDSNGLNLIIHLFPCGLITPLLLLHYTLISHLCNSKQLNATLTKPSAKCNIISQYVVVYFIYLFKESNGSRQN